MSSGNRKNTMMISSRGHSKKNDLVIGRSSHNSPFLLSHLEAHMHVLGKSGSGKSKILELLMRMFLKMNHGFALLDPHGSLFTDLMDYASKKHPHLAERFLVLSLSDPDLLLSFSPIPENAQEHLDVVVDSLITAIMKVWAHDPDTTPRITRWLENIFTLLIMNNLSLADAAQVIDVNKDSDEYKKQLLATVDNPTILSDWALFFKSPLGKRQELMEGAANRLRKFIRSPIIRAILRHHSPRLDLKNVMDEGKILLVNLNGGEQVSRENSKLLGILLMNEFFRVAKLRNHRDPKLKPFYIFLDEFAQFVTRDMALMLDETRKFKLFLIAAHQSLSQLKIDDEYIYGSVLTNCTNKVVFSVSYDDADVMTKELVPGYLDLKTIKDEVFQTKFRPIEETRVVNSTSTGHSEAESESVTETKSRTHGTSKGTSFSRGESATTTVGGSESWGTANTKGITVTDGIAFGTSNVRGTSVTDSRGTNASSSNGSNHSSSTSVNRGLSEGFSGSKTSGSTESKTLGGSTTTGRSRTSSATHGLGSSLSNSTGTKIFQGEIQLSSGNGHGSQKNQSSGTSDSDSKNQSDSWSHAHGTHRGISSSESHGRNFQHGSNRSSGLSQSKGSGTSCNRSQGRNHSRTESAGRSHSVARSRQHTRSHSLTKNWSKSRGESRTTTESEGTSDTFGQSQAQSTGKTRTTSRGKSESVVPYDRKEEFQELSSRTFYSKDELFYFFLSALKNQPTGYVVIKLGERKPIPTAISFVPPVKYSQFTTPLLLEMFCQQIHGFNGKYYVSLQPSPWPLEIETDASEENDGGTLFNKPTA